MSLRSADWRVDVHAHVLPAVDDGPATLEQSLEILRRAAADGTRHIVATPHVDRLDVLEVADRVAELQQAADAQRIPIEILPGGELQAEDTWNLDAARLAAISVPGAERRWILLEPPWRDDIEVVTSAAVELRARGYGVVLAHPERAPGLWREGDRTLQDTFAAGAVAQITAASLRADPGTPKYERALALALSPWPVVVASDAHHPVKRPPEISPVRAALRAAGVPAGRVEELVTTGARALISPCPRSVVPAG